MGRSIVAGFCPILIMRVPSLRWLQFDSSDGTCNYRTSRGRGILDQHGLLFLGSAMHFETGATRLDKFDSAGIGQGKGEGLPCREKLELITGRSAQDVHSSAFDMNKGFAFAHGNG